MKTIETRGPSVRTSTLSSPDGERPSTDVLGGPVMHRGLQAVAMERPRTSVTLTTAVEVSAYARALAATKTPAAFAALDSLVGQSDVVHEMVASSPAIAGELVDSWAAKLIGDIDRLIDAISTGVESVSRMSSGRPLADGRAATFDIRAKTDDYPFDAVTHHCMTFLGTSDESVRQATRQAIVRVITDADSKLPAARDAHKARYIAGETARVAQNESNEPFLRSELAAKYLAEEYLTVFGSAGRVIDALTVIEDVASASFSPQQAVLERAGLLTSLVAAVRDRETKARLAQACIAFYEGSTRTPELFETPEAKTALARVVDAAAGNTMDRAIATKAGAALAARGCVRTFPSVLETLRSGTEEHRREAITTIEASIMSPKRPVNEHVARRPWILEADTMHRVALDELARATQPELQQLATNGQFVWSRIGAARILGLCGTRNVEAVVTYLETMASPSLTRVRFSEDYEDVKNITVRKTAIEALAAMGSRAASAKPALTAMAAAGEKAASVLSYINGLNAGPDFVAEGHVSAAAKCRAVLREVATPRSRAQEALDWADKGSEAEIRATASYARYEQPSYLNVIKELVTVGKVAQSAIDAIDANS